MTGARSKDGQTACHVTKDKKGSRAPLWVRGKNRRQETWNRRNPEPAQLTHQTNRNGPENSFSVQKSPGMDRSPLSASAEIDFKPPRHPSGDNHMEARQTAESRLQTVVDPSGNRALRSPPPSRYNTGVGSRCGCMDSRCHDTLYSGYCLACVDIRYS